MMHEYNKVTSRHFFDSWIKQTRIINQKLSDNWNNRKNYTSFIQNDEDCILQGIANDFRLNYFREYYALDAVFYNDEDKVPNLDASWVWLQNIKIAFEHEHDIKNTYQEISHLVITNCELRVMVTYPWAKEDEYLASYTQIIKSNKTLNANDVFLIIFGYMEEETVSWIAWEYKNDEWCKLLVDYGI